MLDDTNREGLTLKEWAEIAGQEAINELASHEDDEGARKKSFYRCAVYQAWRQAQDPEEWRANPNVRNRKEST